MAFRSALRPLNLAARSSITAAATTTTARGFHSTPPAFVKVGDSIPHLDLTEGSPANKVNIAEELSSADGLIIGVPGAFSMSSPTSDSRQQQGSATDFTFLPKARDALRNTSPAISPTPASEMPARSLSLPSTTLS